MLFFNKYLLNKINKYNIKSKRFENPIINFYKKKKIKIKHKIMLMRK